MCLCVYVCVRVCVCVYVCVCVNEFHDCVSRWRAVKGEFTLISNHRLIIFSGCHSLTAKSLILASFHSTTCAFRACCRLCLHSVDTLRSRSSMCPEIHGASPDRWFSGSSTRADPSLRTSRKSYCTISWYQWSHVAGVFPRVRSLAISVTKNAKRRWTRPRISSPRLGCNASCS